jgi:hypothetical protein
LVAGLVHSRLQGRDSLTDDQKSEGPAFYLVEQTANAIVAELATRPDTTDGVDKEQNGHSQTMQCDVDFVPVEMKYLESAANTGDGGSVFAGQRQSESTVTGAGAGAGAGAEIEEKPFVFTGTKPNPLLASRRP